MLCAAAVRCLTCSQCEHHMDSCQTSWSSSSSSSKSTLDAVRMHPRMRLRDDDGVLKWHYWNQEAASSAISPTMTWCHRSSAQNNQSPPPRQPTYQPTERPPTHRPPARPMQQPCHRQPTHPPDAYTITPHSNITQCYSCYAVHAYFSGAHVCTHPPGRMR